MSRHQLAKKNRSFSQPVFIKGLTLKKPAVLVDADEYEGMRETLEILHEDPKIIIKLKKAEDELKKGKTVSWNKLKDELKL
jgi:PHD/YefM family antitoxin component YafN of YafNO toxin-antitoxin module